MTDTPTSATRHKFTCTDCARVNEINGGPVNPPTEQARLAGWRIGTNGRGEQVCYCPECSGVNEDYWDDMTLAVAYAAGIDAGNQAWVTE